MSQIIPIAQKTIEKKNHQSDSLGQPQLLCILLIYSTKSLQFWVNLGAINLPTHGDQIRLNLLGKITCTEEKEQEKWSHSHSDQ